MSLHVVTHVSKTENPENTLPEALASIQKHHLHNGRVGEVNCDTELGTSEYGILQYPVSRKVSFG